MHAHSRWRRLQRIKRATVHFFLSLLAEILSGDSYSLKGLRGSLKSRFMLRGSEGFQKLISSVGWLFSPKKKDVGASSGTNIIGKLKNLNLCGSPSSQAAYLLAKILLIIPRIVNNDN